jgi:MFS family permease
MASAQFVSNIGGWMQTVGAQELMLTLTTSATLVALIQTAAGLPVVLLAIPAGAIGDLVDRRRLLIASQAFMLLAAVALAVLAFAGLVTPFVLLALIFAVGAGQTLTSPTWQTLQPELVAPEDRTQAIALGSVNQNLSRAIGPAIGGALFAATSAGVLFLVNALSFVPVIGAVARWRGGARPPSLAVVAVAGVWLPFRDISPEDLLPAGDWPDPQLRDAPAGGGPVLVTVEYRPLAGREQDLLKALYAGRYARRRTGAISWRVWRDAGDLGRVLEEFVVGSWDEHLRQHERVSRRDQQRLEEITAMTDPNQPPNVTHWLAHHPLR